MKKIAITGATSGIGLETAKVLLEKGNELIFLVRNPQKAYQLFEKLPNADKIQIIKCDLADLKTVKNAAAELLSSNTHIDVLINNAGGTFEKRILSKDGLELHFAINHIGHFLLVKELWELLEKSKTKIINVSSEAHKAGNIDFKDLNLEKNYSTIKAYGNAKLYNVLFTKSLVRKGFESYALHPGVIDSGFGDNLSGGFKLIWKLGKPFMKTTREGASTSIYLAINVISKDLNGSYFKDKKPTSSSSASRNTAIQDKLWEASEAIIAEKVYEKESKA
jgi:NAD(P)-dependent dehydrogenase (short-subunit alcohol dehydrogenase family)